MGRSFDRFASRLPGIGLRSLRVVLWSVSCGLSILSFYGLASRLVTQLVLCAMGAALDVFKVVAQNKYHKEKDKAFRAAAVGLTLMSLMASMGGAAAIVKGRSQADRTVREQVELSGTEAQDLTRQIKYLQGKMEALDPEWVTTSLKYQNQINDLMARRSELSKEIKAEAVGAKESSVQMFDDLAQVFGRPTSADIVIFLYVFFALCFTELGIWVLHDKIKVKEDVPMKDAPKDRVPDEVYDLPAYVSLRPAASAAGVSHVTLYRAIEKGEIRAAGKDPLTVRKNDLIYWIKYRKPRPLALPAPSWTKQ